MGLGGEGGGEERENGVRVGGGELSEEGEKEGVGWVMKFFFLMIRRPPRSTQSGSSAASDVYKGRDHLDHDERCDLLGVYDA